jgi:hypothetical protein
MLFRLFLLFSMLILFTLPITCADGAGRNDEVIVNDAQGEECLADAKRVLASLGVTVDRTILLKVRPREEVQVHFNSTGSRNISVGGYYQAFNPETIWMVAGHSKTRTTSDIAHELAHAWQSSNCPLQDRIITEGFATWCGFKTALMLGDRDFASRILGITAPDYAEGLKLFLAVEKKEGIPGVIQFARTATKP